MAYYQGEKVKTSRILSWLSNTSCKLYIKLTRLYLLCISWSIYNKWFSNSDCGLISYVNWDRNYDRSKVNIKTNDYFNTLYINKSHWSIKPGSESWVGIDDNIQVRNDIVLIRFSKYWLLKLITPSSRCRVNDIILLK